MTAHPGSGIARVMADRDAALSSFVAERVPGAAARFDAAADVLHIICPASVTFDAAEALRLELVAGAPAGVTVDVEIAAGSEGSAEDQAGRRLFGELRGERLGTPGIPGHCATLSVCASSGDAIHPPAWRERGE